MPSPNTFLFVNKTVNSKSLSNNRTGGVSYAQINRQAQLVAKSRRKITGRRTETKRQAIESAALSETTSPVSSGPLTPPKAAEEVCSVIDDQVDETGEIDFGSPIPTFDSVCSSVVALDRNKQHVLEYYTTIWMPSKDHIPPGCQITGLTPVRPNDGEIAFHVVQEAFQSHDEVSMYALLTAGSRRMQVLHNKSLPRPELPDVYNVKAIHTLRKRIERGEPPSERLILDLSFLILAELFTPSPTRSELYWNMIRSLIMQCGGLHRLTTYTAQIAMGFDHQVSAGTLSKPALDPFEYPELLGFKPDRHHPQREVYQQVMTLLSRLDPRLRLIALEVHALTDLVNAIHRLPRKTVAGTLVCVRAKVRQLYGVVTEPLRRVDGREAPEHNSDIIVADSMYLHVRVSTWRTWLWYASLSFMPFTTKDHMRVPTPPVIQREVPRTWQSIHRIQQLLQGTGWITSLDLLFWTAAVGFFAATSVFDRHQYRVLLIEAASKLGITSLEKVVATMANHFPLELMQPAAYDKLWEAVRESAVRSEHM